MTHPNATPGKAIYLDEFIYEEGTPIGKCYQCDLPNPFTNNQVLTEGVDYVKQWHVKPGGQTNWINVDEATYEIYYNQDRRRIIALPLQAEKREGEKESVIDFIERRFVDADGNIKWDEQFKGFLLNKLITNKG